jgi:hypothetical protein
LCKLFQSAGCDLTEINGDRESIGLMQVNVACRLKPYHFQKSTKSEIIMLEFYEPGASVVEDSVAKTVQRVNNTNKRVLEFIFGVQKAMLDEVIFVSNEVFDRVRTETHLFGELSSKIAGSHSVKDLKTMCEECGQHQIDYVRRDSERLFKHSERMIEVTSELFSSRPQI